MEGGGERWKEGGRGKEGRVKRDGRRRMENEGETRIVNEALAITLSSCTFIK